MSEGNHNPGEVEKLKHVAPIPGIPEAILKRWSPRAFEAKPITDEQLHTLFTAARWAASSYNEQPWRFIVGRKGEGPLNDTWEKIHSTLIDFNKMWTANASVLILSVASMKFAKNGHPNAHAMYDTGAATQNLALTATELGLHTHSMAGYDAAKARELFSIPADYEPAAVTAVGYFGDPAALPEQARAMEVSPRERKPLDRIVFSAWEQPLAL